MKSIFNTKCWPYFLVAFFITLCGVTVCYADRGQKDIIDLEPVLRFYWIEDLGANRREVLSYANPAVYPFLKKRFQEFRDKLPLLPVMAWANGEHLEIDVYPINMRDETEKEIILNVYETAEDIFGRSFPKINLKSPDERDIYKREGVNIWVFPGPLPRAISGKGPTKNTKLIPIYYFSQPGKRILFYSDLKGKALQVDCILSLVDYQGGVRTCLAFIKEMK